MFDNNSEIDTPDPGTHSVPPSGADGELVMWVDSDAALRDAVAEWGAVIGLDTEFRRTDTFYPIPGLYQIAANGRVWLIDPLAVSDFTPLKRVLTDAGVLKIMHASSEDLELIYSHLGIQVSNLFDTQFAFAFLSAHYSLSYTALVSELLGIHLEQHQTRSDWLQRPLTGEQLSYAVEDVWYLQPLQTLLSTQLKSLGRSEWFAQEMLARSVFEPMAPELYFLQVKKAWQLSAEQLGVLKALCTWREGVARSTNVPRRRVVWDEHLLLCARRTKLQHSDLRQWMPERVVRRFADALLEVHASAIADGGRETMARPLTQSQSGCLKDMREAARTRADTLGMSVELLARKRDMEQCLRTLLECGQLSPAYTGWREPLVGQVLRDVFSAYVSGIGRQAQRAGPHE